MKKISLLFLSSFLTVASFAQVTIGLRASSVVCMDRVKDLNNADGYEFKNNSSGIRFAVGPTFDFAISDNYAFSTGAWYLSRRSGLSINSPSGVTNPATNPFSLYQGSVDQKDIVSLQSVQIPITFKVYTNEITTNVKLYFQLGALATINFYEKFKSQNSSLVGDYQNKYNAFDVSAYMAAGVNYQIGESNALFAGLYYSRGLTNVLNSRTSNTTNEKFNKSAKYNMDLIGLEVGINF
ncbi:porin family protein [uncultured Cytophaga sp.]|uniref:porin family protein n=1 Tax=uncultured Cytophaga sp. TaxID=160238 RepID=UPI0026113184|nr:porin family protein [uncultured Cytophaga sp.]